MKSSVSTSFRAAKEKEEWAIGALYPRERLAYLVSEALALNLVPPTIIREVSGRIGSIRYFIPHEAAPMASRYPCKEEPSRLLRESDDSLKNGHP